MMTGYGGARGAIRSSLHPSPLTNALLRHGLPGLNRNRRLPGEGVSGFVPGPPPIPVEHVDHAPMPGPGPGPIPIDGAQTGYSPLLDALAGQHVGGHRQQPRAPRRGWGGGAGRPFAGHLFGGQQF